MLATQTFRDIFVPPLRDSADDSDYVVCHDNLYSAHGLLSKADGSIAERYDYDAYGQPVIYTATASTPDGNWWDGDEVTADVSAKGLPYLFTGREYDPLDGADSNYLKLQYSRARYYSFDLRRWLQRDPLEYSDGMSLYEYIQSVPTMKVDPNGLWAADVHRKLTEALAKKAGIACADKVGAGANSPDEDERDAPSSFKKAMKLRAAAAAAFAMGRFKLARLLRAQANRLLRRAADWHFPADNDGVVRPDSNAANAKINSGTKNCDFKAFSHGLHTLQDSWSHQGKPYKDGVGHARGVIWIPKRPIMKWNWRSLRLEISGWTPGHWKKLSGAAAALSKSADYASRWSKDVRTTGKATYKALKDFKNRCPCRCPGANGKNTATSSGRAAGDDEIRTYLNTAHGGPNVVD